MICSITKITFNQLPDLYKLSTIFCIFITFFSFLIMYFTKIKSINTQELAIDINRFNKISVNKVEPAFFVISPYIPFTKNQNQILPHYLIDRINMYSILETFWWAEYSLWKKQKKWLIPNFILALRFLANSMALAMIYVIIFWFLGFSEFQKLDFIGIIFVMFLWVFFFGAITTTYIHQKVVNYINNSGKISKKDSIKIKRCAAWFWIWPLANVVFEHTRLIMWFKNYYKYKNINKK